MASSKRTQRIECRVEEVDLENDNGRTQPGVLVTCSECNHAEASFGTEEKSVKRCLALIRENCPRNETTNFYVADHDLD